MTFAVHNLHAPAVETIEGGYTLTPGVVIKLGDPIHTAASFEEAEAWRLAELERMRT